MHPDEDSRRVEDRSASLVRGEGRGRRRVRSDRARAKRVADAMLRMVKLDVAALRAAYDGDAAA